MTTLRVPGPSLRDRLGAVVDRLAHPRRTRELARATGGFRAAGVIRAYPNSGDGRRLEATDTRILWHRGYRPPIVIVHDAIWRTGGPSITISYSRERVPAFVTPLAERAARNRGVLGRR